MNQFVAPGALDFDHYAPVSAAERAAIKAAERAGGLGLGTTPTAETAPTAAPAPAAPVPAPAPAYRIAGGPARSCVEPLVWPIMGDDGALIEEVEVCRMTVAQVRDYLDAADGGAEPYPPMFRSRGKLLPPEALDALDQDDWVRLDKRALDFLPDALRGALSSSARATGAASPA